MDNCFDQKPSAEKNLLRPKLHGDVTIRSLLLQAYFMDNGYHRFIEFSLLSLNEKLFKKITDHESLACLACH